METTSTTIIDCSPEHLWPWIEEPDKQKQWMKGLLENVDTSDGPTRVGSTFRMTIQEGRRVTEYDGEVTNYDPYRHLGVRFWGAAHGDLRADRPKPPRPGAPPASVMPHDQRLRGNVVASQRSRTRQLP